MNIFIDLHCYEEGRAKRMLPELCISDLMPITEKKNLIHIGSASNLHSFMELSISFKHRFVLILIMSPC